MPREPGKAGRVLVEGDSAGTLHRAVGGPVGAPGTVQAVAHDVLPPDPFADDPDDPARAFGDPEDRLDEPISDSERTELLADLSDLAVYQALLEPRGVRGIVVDCGECDEPHYHDWHLLRASLEQLLADGRMRPHEPAYDPNPGDYVSWDYCRGFADGVTANESAY